jgi:flagellar biosynthetic protein FliP
VIGQETNPFSLFPLTFGMEENPEPGKIATSIKIIFFLTIITLAPSILIMMTSFTRIVVVLAFLRQAMGAQQIPPPQIIISLALFLTFFIMAPAWQQINAVAIQPYIEKEITPEAALEKALSPFRTFMLRQTRDKDLALFLDISRKERPQTPSDIPTTVLIPSFVISELGTAFQMGFLIYLPFLIIDMVVASVLMSMGMIMLPPVIISLPFKLLLFVLVDGWHLVVGSLVGSFYS